MRAVSAARLWLAVASLVVSMGAAGIAEGQGGSHRPWLAMAYEAALSHATADERVKWLKSLIMSDLREGDADLAEKYGLAWVEAARVIDASAVDQAHQDVMNRLVQLDEPEMALAWADRHGLVRPPGIQVQAALQMIDAGDVWGGIALARQTPHSDHVHPLRDAAIRLAQNGWIREAVALHRELGEWPARYAKREMLKAAVERGEEGVLISAMQPADRAAKPLIGQDELAGALAKAGRIDEALAILPRLDPRWRRGASTAVIWGAVIHNRIDIAVDLLRELPRERRDDRERADELEHTIADGMAQRSDLDALRAFLPNMRDPHEAQDAAVRAGLEAARQGQRARARDFIEEHVEFDLLGIRDRVRVLTALGQHQAAFALAIETDGFYVLFKERCDQKLWAEAVEALPRLDNVFLRVNYGGRLITAAQKAGRKDWLRAIRLDLRQRLVAGDSITEHYRGDLERLEAQAAFLLGDQAPLRRLMDTGDDRDRAWATMAWAWIAGDEGVWAAWRDLTPTQRHIAACERARAAWIRDRDAAASVER